MSGLRLLFSPSGRLPPQTFAIAATAVYLAGAASHLLTMPGVIMGAGPWPFLAAQALLTWIWFSLHAKRLRDGNRPVGLAAGVGLLYALSIALLVIVAAAFDGALAGEVPDANAASALGLILLATIIANFLGAPHYDLAWLIVAMLLLIAILPIVLAVVTTVWAATRPSADGTAA
jgi:hypothetical protein